MVTLLMNLISRLGPGALGIFSKRASIAVGTKLPIDKKGLIAWFAANPKKTQVGLAALYPIADKAIQVMMDESDEVTESALMQAVITRYRSSQRAVEEIQEIVGDGKANTVHGVNRDDYIANSVLHKDQELLIKRAISIVGSKTNLMILRDALLTVEPVELEQYGK